MTSSTAPAGETVTPPAHSRVPNGSDDADFDAIVIGAGHNGLITAAYLSRAGLRTLLLEARAEVGGTAGSETFAGATVNICNCDHLTFRTTPIADELGLADQGLTYLDVDPALHNMSWAGGPPWTLWHDVDATLESLGEHYPDEVDNYRRYVRTARPIVEFILRAAAEPPDIGQLTRLAVARRMRGIPNLLLWSRRSAASILRSFFRHDAISATAAMTGPMVWGLSPELPGTGLGAITHAIRHVVTTGRPVGGSGMVPTTIRRAFEQAGGVLHTSARVATIRCDGQRVIGVTLADGREFDAGIVVSACNPHQTFLEWLREPPPAAAPLVARWRTIAHAEGYESKIDAVLTHTPEVRGLTGSPATTLVVAPTLAEMHRAYRLMSQGHMLERPGLLVNIPSMLDPGLCPADRQLLSLEALFTPYRVAGGWASNPAPRQWLEAYASLCEPGVIDSIVDWRAMTPDIYEREFHLPAGHATSFAGGPLAAVRSRDPELTRYETAVPGLYLTGAATFPGAGVWGAAGRNCAMVVLGARERSRLGRR